MDHSRRCYCCQCGYGPLIYFGPQESDVKEDFHQDLKEFPLNAEEYLRWNRHPPCAECEWRWNKPQEQEGSNINLETTNGRTTNVRDKHPTTNARTLVWSKVFPMWLPSNLICLSETQTPVNSKGTGPPLNHMCGLLQEHDYDHFDKDDAGYFNEQDPRLARWALKVFTVLIEAISAFTSGGCALLLAGYNRSLSRRSHHSRYDHGSLSNSFPEQSFETGLQLPFLTFLEDPSPNVVAVAVLLYSVGVSILYCSHRHDEHINIWLAAGVCIALTLGLLDKLDVRRILYKLLPGSVLASLLASALFHRWCIAGSPRTAPMTRASVEIKYGDAKEVI